MIDSRRAGRILLAPWLLVALGIAMVVWSVLRRDSLDDLAFESSQAEARAARYSRLQSLLAADKKRLAELEAAESRTRDLLRRDLLLLRGLAAIEETLPEGMWVDSWSWRTIDSQYGLVRPGGSGRLLPVAPSYQIQVHGFVRARTEDDARTKLTALRPSRDAEGRFEVELSIAVARIFTRPPVDGAYPFEATLGIASPRP